MSSVRSQSLNRFEGRELFRGKAPKKGRYSVAPKSDRTVDGICFDSKAEAGYYAELKLRERAGEVSNIRLQVPLEVKIDGKPFATFTVDFVFCHGPGLNLIAYHEVKSNGTKRERDYKLRRKAAELYHGIEIVEVLR